MVGNGLGVRRADADIDQRYALMVRRCEMIGGHLRAMPGGRGDERGGLAGRVVGVDTEISGQVQPVVWTAGPQLLESPLDELVHIAMIICQKDPGLNEAPVRTGVMNQATQ